jgi:type I restriction enzyme S subunit
LETLGDLVKLQRGNTYKSRLLGSPGPVLLGLASIRPNGGFRDEALRTYGGESPAKLLLHPGDLYVSLKDVTQSGDLLGAIARVPQSVPIGRLTQDTVALLPRSSNVPMDFVYWSLRTPQYREYCRARAMGTTNLSLSRNDFLAFEVGQLSIEKQWLVVLLQALEDKIRHNQKTSATLEELARALFASWFGVLDPEQVPYGWTVAPLSQHVEVTRGLSYMGAGLSDDGIPLQNLDSIYEGGGYKYHGLKHYRGEYKDRHVVRAGDLLVANTEQGFEHLLIGCPALVPERFGDLSLFSHHLYRVRPKAASLMTARFLYLALMSRRLRQVVIGYSNGTTVNMLPADALQRPRLAVPPTGVVQRFDGIVAPFFARQEQLQLESETLARLRDVLLPKLMSGEIRLNEAEKAVVETL